MRPQQTTDGAATFVWKCTWRTKAWLLLRRIESGCPSAAAPPARTRRAVPVTAAVPAGPAAALTGRNTSVDCQSGGGPRSALQSRHSNRPSRQQWHSRAPGSFAARLDRWIRCPTTIIPLSIVAAAPPTYTRLTWTRHPFTITPYNTHPIVTASTPPIQGNRRGHCSRMERREDNYLLF